MEKTVSQGFRLSPRQQHVWRAQRGESSPGLAVQTRVDVAGPLDRRRLARAVERVVERHEILRTTFPLLPSLSIPVQSVEETAAVDWSERSLREADLDRLAAEVRDAPFDLARGPLLRVTLAELESEPGRELHALLLTLPALCADGASLDLLTEEIVAAYHGAPAGDEALQYADLAEILHDWEASPADEPGAAFWRAQDLSGLERVTLGRGETAGDRPYRPATVSLGLNRDRLERAAARLGAPVSRLLLAAWQGMLCLSTGEEEVVVGTLFDGRTLEELESALGPFARYLPVSGRATVDSALEELSRALSATLNEAARHQDLFSSESLAKTGWPFGFDFRIPRRLAEGPPGFTIRGGYLGLDRFDARLSVLDDGRSLRADLVHDPARFGRGDAERLLERFSRVLDGLLAGSPLGEIDVLTEAERRQVLAFNRTEVPLPADLCAHHLFEEQVRRAPQATALIHAGEAWTYAELNARANRLARHLRAAGLGPGSQAGIFLERSPDLVAAVLGVLKTGAAYVPLDPGSPAGRRAAIAEDAALALLITREWLDDHHEEISLQSDEDPPRSAGPADLAYILYTSGSTGRPKGVMVPHRGLANYLLWAREAYAAGEGAGAPVHSTIGFDLTVTSLLVPLAAGTPVLLLEEGGDGRSPVEALAAALRGTAGFSLVKLTPAHLDLLGRELRPEEYEGRTGALVIGGEALHGDRVAPWRQHAPGTRLINEYGPTEATVGCCVYEIGPGDAAAGPVPIGRPIANTRLYVVGPRLRPVPLGAPGELWIGGDGLARGYLGRPGLTAERFVPDPFATEEESAGRVGERLYRTGDLVRLGAEGQLEFLGRVDHQIKIRGFRVEPGEIEAALGSHAEVREAAVLAEEEPAGVPILVACVAGKAGAGALRRHLLERLPEPMVPSRFALFETLPLTPNGKVDRKELARTWRERAAAREEGGTEEAPRTWTEELLAGMFADLLGAPSVGRNESFFALGGHSLLATQAISRVREAFGVEISLRGFFEVPTVASLGAKVEALRSRGGTVDLPPLLPVPRNTPAPLSFAQQRLWFIAQLDPASPLYNIPVGLRVEGRLRPEVLALCLAELTRRHEALRTVFATRDGEPVQEIRTAAAFALPLVDLSGLPEPRREAAALALAAEEAARPFDLARGPLFRALLLRLGAEDHIAALTLHHIVSDGWSMGVLVREVSALYAAFAEGSPSPLPELPVQYADFAVWQRSWLRGEALERQISFWRRQLAGLPPLLELPTDRPRPAVLSYRGASRPVRLPASLARRLQALSRREGATLFMVLLAGFQALLARHSGQRDLAVGTPVAGRNRIETEGLIGFFVNTLVLRGDLHGDPPFRELISRTRDAALAAYAHQDVPFEKLIEELSPERSLAHTPLFQAVLALHNAPVGSLEVEDLRLRPLSGAGTTAKFDLLFSLEEWDGGLLGTVEHSTDLFDAATIERLFLQYERLLTAAVEDPDLAVPDLPLLPDSERHQILAEWNDTAVGRGESTLIHELFEAWAARTPGAVAAVCGGNVLTYGDLAERTHRLAWHLIRLGVGPGSLVGIHLRRSLDMIPALLAVLEAGAAYVPLEIGHPPARLQWIIGALDISCVLTQSEQRDVLPELPHVICLDRVELAGERPEAPPRRGAPDDLAYIIFTSGSTGTPKGVMVRHRPVVNLFRWAYRTFDFSPADRVLFITSLAFDLSVFDVFGLLGAGGSIRIATEEEIRDPRRLLRALAEEPITFWDSAPAALEQTVPFLAVMDPEARPVLRLVFLSGDWIPVTLPDRVRERFPGARVISLGGATEATVWSNVFPIGTVDPAWKSIPYGRPIDNARYHVLDGRLAPCPAGVSGDLYIGGDCLADGYAREPELTAGKFIPDPWSATPGARLYRTGDRARYRPDGNLEFLGRLDHQVKIRGFRIELGEIEAALATLPGVRDAVVVVREDTPGDRRLVAYVTGDAVADDLRPSLQERLPEHMVPAAFVSLAALPLTPNGKVNRKALPAPEWHRTEESHVAPRTPAEEIVAGIWAEVLGLDRVGATDHFFELGGHSLLATQVMSRLGEAFGIELPLRELFEAPVLADLAAQAEAARRQGAARTAPPLVRVPREGPLPLSFAQQRLWFIEQLAPGNTLYNIPMALRVEGPLRPEVLALCLGEITRRHEVLRTVFAAPDGSPVQIIQPPAPFALPLVDLSGQPGLSDPSDRSDLSDRSDPQVRLALALAGEEAARPFDLTDLRRGPLLRAVLLRLGAADHVVLPTLHHIAGDGWSLGILVREITALYTAAVEGKPSPLPELPVQYADYSAWQHAWLRGEVLDAEIAFWRRQLAGLPPLLELPTDRPRPAVQSPRGTSEPVRLPAGLGRRVQALGRREGATLFMVLLAGFDALLARYSGQRDLAVGTPVAGRNRVEIEGLIGFFVNTLVLRADLSGAPAFRELLGRIRETALAAHAHQDVPFEKLVQELAPERSLAHTPLFQVMLSVQTFPSAGTGLPGLSMAPVALETTAVKFDLELTFAEEGGELSARLDFASDLFDRATIRRMAGHLAALLEAATADPDRGLGELPLLGAAESHQLQSEWNDTAAPAAPGVVELFAAQARRSPAAVALVSGEGARLTYRQLAGRAERLAWRLRALGVGPEVTVGLCVEHGPELAVGILGIWQAGGAYLPLDPAHPPARLAFLLEDSVAPVLVTQPHLLAGLPSHGAKTVLLEGEEEVGEVGVLDGRPAPGDLAYLIYTSGTTGRPKAVQVGHGMLAATLAATRELFGFTADDRVPCLALPTFDISLFELLSPLLTGGTAVLFPMRPTLDVERLVDHLGELTRLHAVPALLRQIVDALRSRGAAAPDVRRLRTLFTGGDVVPAELLEDVRQTFPAARVWVLYGPTEGTIVCTAHPVPPPPAPARPLLGRPLAGARVEIRDADGGLLPIGVPGELWIGGAGVTRGYLRRDELTAERYVARGGERFYRSGDRARRLADGTLEFLGRLDDQVKVRGFRIEPGEVEAALRDIPGVREAVVLARSAGSSSDRRLVAYVVGDVAVAELRRSLGERLPAYMVPAAFVALPALPLSPNGKVDRAALPAPDAAWAGLEREPVAPRTREEEILAAVWAQVLRLPRVGVEDNFFELGGDSILSLQIAARARQAGLLVTVRQLFEVQTVAGLARLATPLDATDAGPEQGPVAGEVPLTPIQRWFFEQDFADPHHFNQALLLEPAEPLVPAALERALAAVVAHHDALRMRFRRDDRGGWCQENAAAEPITPFHRVDLSGLSAPRRREAMERAGADLQTGFDLTTGPLTRLALFDAGDGSPGLLSWVTHHLVVDAVSWRVLLEDLETAYRQGALPPKTASFRDWARRLAAHAGSEEIARELEHWLGDARTPVPPLPVDFPGDRENTTGTEAAAGFELTVEETADLLRTVPAIFHTRIDEALLSALARAVAGWTGSPRCRVDLEGHGREPLFEDLDTSRTVGWFTTRYPVVLEAEDDPGTALVSAKERLRAVPGRGIGYGLLTYLRGCLESPSPPDPLSHPLPPTGRGGRGEWEERGQANSSFQGEVVPPPLGGWAAGSGGGQEGGSFGVAEIAFNYLGQLDAPAGATSLFRPSLSPGPIRSPRARRSHLVEVGAMVAGDRLRVTLTYGSRVHRRETAERLAEAYAGALRELIRHSRTCQEEVFTPSDFPRAGLDARGLDKLRAGLAVSLKEVEDVYPLSPLQNGMLFHGLMAPESGVYVSQLTCTLPADLDTGRFRQAWETLVARHAVLRTAFVWDGLDEPLQAVHRSVPLPWQELDWSGLSAHEQRRRFEDLRHDERHAPLPLDRAPLLRFALVRLGAELGFVWTFHHLLLDGWSLPLLVQELASVYAALEAGRPPTLPPVRPFSDYIAWLRRQDLSRAEAFWRRELAGFAAPTPLGIGHPAAAAGDSAEHEVRVPAEIAAALQTLAARHRVTLQTVTLGAWAVLLGRYSGEPDVVFGSVVSGRPTALPRAESMIGLFINTLPARVRVDDAEPLGPWLRRLQERQLARLDFEHTPLHQIQRWSEVPAGSPLFETLQVFENYPVPAGDGGGLRIGDLRSLETTNYPLTLMLRGGDEIPLRLVYDRARVEDAAVPRLLHHLATLLAGMAAGPEHRLGELTLLSAAERQQLVVEWNGEWNDTEPPLPERVLLHELVEAQALSTPDAPAVTFDGETLTYAGLHDRADRLARRLRDLGCGPESRVGVALERSLDLIVALLGVLRAGAAYLPLDPGYPRERLALVLEDAAPRVIVTRRPLLAVLPSFFGEVFCLEPLTPRPPLPPPPADRERGRRSKDVSGDLHLAYVLYTSGSTGRPKGVGVPHRALVNFLRSMQRAPGFAAGERLLAVTPVAFDIAALEIFLPLITGGCVELAGRAEAADGRLLAERLRASGASVLQATPATWRMLLDGGWPGDPHLRALCGGEALPRDLAASLAGRTRELWNLYGPTETTVWSTAARVRPDETGPVSIGRPIAATRVHVLDREMRPVPLGVTGELWIGGAGVARGYLGRPDLTAERFLPDPLADDREEPGSRLYRTGDLARHLSGSRMEVLGRVDHQIKLRGFRIELGEIEAALAGLDGVREAVVTVREDTPGDRRLVAYVVGDADPAALRQALRERLPDFMVPGAFVTLPALPLTPNGKVDRKALPAPEQPAADGHLAPRTLAEERLAAIWAGVLRTSSPVGAGDDFFALGGHSLLATQVVSRVQESFGVDLPLRALFESPRLSDLAARIEAEAGRAGVLLPEARRTVEGEGYPLSDSQARLWFLDRLTPGSPAYHIASPLRLRGPLDPAVLERCFEEVIRRHESLRTRFAERNGAPVQIVGPPFPWSLPEVDLTALPEALRGAEAERWRNGEVAWPFDLAGLRRGPLLRTLLLRLGRDRLGRDERWLLLTVHHIVSDGWSVLVLIRELTDLYRAFVAGRPSPLPALPLQYADFARWQRERLSGPELESHLAYWRERLAGSPPSLDLPLDRPRPAVQTFRGGSVLLTLDAGLTAELRALAASERASLFMLLLAAFKLLLRRWSGQDDVVAGAPVAGRDRRDFEGLIGFFLNTLTLRTDLSGRPTFRELLRRERETVLGALSHQEVPFERLLADLQPERDLSRTPLFQVFFNMLNFPSAAAELPGGVSVEVLPRLDLDARFDLTVYAAEVGPEVELTVVYNADLFDRPRIEELARQYRGVLVQAAADADLPIDRISLLTPEAKALLPDPAAPLGDEWHGAVHELFAERARRHPERPALIDAEGTWTYGELADAVGRLAARLREAGVDRGDRVAIYAHRSAPVVWAVLATLEAGAAFVLLDPAYPAARLAETVRLATPKAWLEIAAAGAPPPELEALLAEIRPAIRLRLPGGGPAPGAPHPLAPSPTPSRQPGEGEEGELGERGRPSPGRWEGVGEGMGVRGSRGNVGPDDLAYLAFTSGSTGTPKGIAGRHGPLSHFLPWQCERFGLGETDRYSLLSGLAHDPLQRDIFTPLATGATLCIPTLEEIATPGRLASWMADRGITVAHLTPAMGQILTEPGPGGETAEIPALRYTFLVGDVLTRLDADRIRRLAPRVTVVNLYGTTETQRAVGFHVVEEGGVPGEPAKQVLPLGRGMRDVQLLVVSGGDDPALAGIGELGELWVRSPHLARGYLEDEAITADRFRTNPFTGRDGDRVYRTGDLGRYLPDGQAVFVGRADQQVKIRGFRIELGEIEATLGRLPGVREAVVLAREDGRDPGARRLVAYVVPDPESPADIDALRDALRDRLPAYMVPAVFVRLDRLPVTPNGKVDRRALPAPEGLDAGLETTYVEPESDLERIIAEVWSELLGLEKVGVRHNFFDLGGHSLLLVRLHARLQEELHRELSLIELFNYPNIRALAEHLGRKEAEAPAVALESAKHRAQKQIEAARRQKERARGRGRTG